MATIKRRQVHFDSEIIICGDTYYFRGTPVGHRRRVECSLKLKLGTPQKEVLSAKKELINSLEAVGARAGRNNFESISSKYVQYREKEAEDPRLLSQKTLNETRSIVRDHLCRFFGKSKVEEISQAEFNEYCLLKKKKNLNLVNHRKVLNHFLKWCVQNNYLKYRPELEIPKFARRTRRPREVLTDSEIRGILNITDLKTLCYVSLYLLHGMRNMEICKLRWDEIDWEKRGVFINPLNNRRRKSRAIPLNDFSMNLLRKIKSELDADSEWVFPSRLHVGKKPHMDPNGGMSKRWAKAMKEAGITRKITPHDLRATFETFMHTNTEFTDTQREKMAGARIDVQKDHYVKMNIDHLRGLENSVQVKGLDKVLEKKTAEICGGNAGGKRGQARD